jgi:hypothetical protein
MSWKEKSRKFQIINSKFSNSKEDRRTNQNRRRFYQASTLTTAKNEKYYPEILHNNNEAIAYHRKDHRGLTLTPD